MDLTSRDGRRKVVEYIESNANKGRKVDSYKSSEVLADRIEPYVTEELRKQFSEQTVREIPKVSSVNIAKRVVNSLACIYRDAPERDWTDLSDDQKEIVKLVYDDMGANKKLNLANKIYKNHDQCLIQVLPKYGRLIMRVLKPHQWDCIPSESDPEVPMAIIISAYDNLEELMEASKNPRSATGYQTTYESNKELHKNKEAIDAIDEDDKKKYLVWTNEENFIINSSGDIEGEVLPNPIGMLPFVEVHREKEFEYWVRAQNTFAQFTVEFNSCLSQIQQIVKMQGFSVAILKSPAEMKIENVQIGPNMLLHLPYDPAANIDCDFAFASPSADIAGSLQFLETLLTSFLSSNGIDPKTVTVNGEGQTYTSGVERLLAMIEKVSASKEDYDTFEKIEQKLWELVSAWLVNLGNSETLEQKYQISNIPESSKCVIEYAKPELVKSDMEELDVIQREIDLGISSPVKAIMEREKLSREDALEKYFQYQAESLGLNGTETIGE